MLHIILLQMYTNDQLSLKITKFPTIILGFDYKTLKFNNWKILIGI